PASLALVCPAELAARRPSAASARPGTKGPGLPRGACGASPKCGLGTPGDKRRELEHVLSLSKWVGETPRRLNSCPYDGLDPHPAPQLARERGLGLFSLHSREGVRGWVKPRVA
ncbi:MAG: hypothetical protein J4N80_11075, partial [Chloroflexi bacterium]|nr:hypothetical protein [Chloroflexota bacterium]